MKYTNDIYRSKFILFCMLSVLLINLGACGSVSYELSYDADSDISGFNILADNGADTAAPFARDLCIVTGDQIDPAFADTSQCTAALLLDISNKEVLYAQNAHEKLFPASLTKVLTALVALKYGSMDQILTASNSVYVNESGAQVCGLKPGDTMTLHQALYVALINSANDAALLIAENIGGTVDNFVNMMNEEAKVLGATNSHFVNPHGLTDAEQYTTAYDMYLIFNEAVKYETFVEIIQCTAYETTYHSSTGEAKTISVRNTNRYVNADTKAPENVTVIGGKTGTTNAAGHCLVLLSRDKNGSPYISVILGGTSRDGLYAQMTDLLDEINK